jgi:hypothetical protein
MDFMVDTLIEEDRCNNVYNIKSCEYKRGRLHGGSSETPLHSSVASTLALSAENQVAFNNFDRKFVTHHVIFDHSNSSCNADSQGDLEPRN